MFKNKLVLVLFLVIKLTGVVAYSQAPSLSWGETQKIKRGFYGKEIVYENGKHLFVAEKEDKDIDLLFFQISRPALLHLSAYDVSTFELIKETTIYLPEKKKEKYNYRFLKLLEVNGQLLLFIKAQNEKTEELKLLVQKLSSTGEQKGPFLELEDAGSEKTGILFTKSNSGDFDIISSPNKKQFATIKIEPFNEDSLKRFYVKLFNQDLDILWSGLVELPYKEEFYQLRKYRLSNEGNLMFLGKKWHTYEKQGVGGKTKTKIEKSEEGKPNYTYNFLLISTNGESDSYDIDLKDKFISEIDFIEQNCPDTIVFSGFYSPRDEKYLKGTFSVAINHLENKILYTKTKPFSDEFLNLFDGPSSLGDLFSSNNNPKSLQEFRMDDLVVRDDGSSILVAEKYFVQVNTSNIRDAYGYSRTTTSYTYNYEDIIAIYFDPNGEVQWCAKIPKHQTTFNDGGPYSSYVMNVNNQGMSFVFNDHEDNLERIMDGNEVRNVNNFRRAETVVVTIDNAGKMNRKVLFSAKDEGLVFRPKSSWYPRDIYKSNAIYLFGLELGIFKRTTFKIGAIKFPE